MKNKVLKKMKNFEIVRCMKRTFFLTVTRSIGMFPFMYMSLHKKCLRFSVKDFFSKCDQIRSFLWKKWKTSFLVQCAFQYSATLAKSIFKFCKNSELFTRSRHRTSYVRSIYALCQWGKSCSLFSPKKTTK